MKMNLRMKLMAGFIAVLIIVVAVSVVSYQSESTSQQATGWVTHTDQVVAADQNAVLGLVNMETGFRGYLISGQDSSRTPTAAARRSTKTPSSS